MARDGMSGSRRYPGAAKVAWALVGVLAVCGSARAAPTWVVDPLDPGPDRPPAGRSLFDHLFTVVRDGRGTYVIPYPFEALTAHVERRAAAGGRTALQQVLIPRGRSLQRDAAAPDFDRHPRIVVAVDAEGGGDRTPLLRDRLYLGYQERAESIEVISYNDEAGRFEFQVVRDYAPGRRPRVKYARRSLCMACHQNGGPIFAERPWSETNAEPRVADELALPGGRFHGVPRRVPGETALAIDASTDEATLFAAHQYLWRDGCGGAGGRHGPERCRAAVLVALLQFRLTGRAGFETASRRYRIDLAGPLGDTWRRRWPGGLAIPGADLPDPAESALGRGGPLDPLHPRPPAAVWSGEPPIDRWRVVAGLAEFLSASDVRWVDARLVDAASRPGTRRETHRATCEARDGVAGALDVSCEGGFRLRATLRTGDGRAPGGVVRRLLVPGMRSLYNLQVDAGEAAHEESGRSLRLRLMDVDHGIRVRRVDGAAVEAIEITLRAPVGKPGDGARRAAGDGVVTLVDDFDWLERAVDALVASGADAAAPLSARPFRRDAVLEALARHLGVAGTAPGSRGAGPMPPLEVEGEAELTARRRAFRDLPPAVGAAFARYCARCHGTASPVPPNFLLEGPVSVRRKLAVCAGRLYVRLHAWGRKTSGESRAPMPPVSALHVQGMTADAWQRSEALGVLQAYAGALVRQVGGFDRAQAALDDGTYDALPPCAPMSTGPGPGRTGRPGNVDDRGAPEGPLQSESGGSSS